MTRRDRWGRRLCCTGAMSGVVFVMIAGCVDAEPRVTGKREAGAEVQPIGTSVPLPDEPDVDPRDCRRCAEALSTDAPRGTVCRKNGDPSSARRFNAIVDCLC